MVKKGILVTGGECGLPIMNRNSLKPDKVTPKMSCQEVCNFILPTNAKYCVANHEMWSTPLLPEEEQLSLRMKTNRKQEFQAGRACARILLTDMGYINFPLLRGDYNEPIWPDTIVGSITHADGLCVVTIAKNTDFIGIGIDIEKFIDLESSILQSICTDHEIKYLSSVSEPKLVSVFFSIKESIFKCVNPILHRWIDFTEIHTTINPETNQFTCRHVNNDEDMDIFSKISGKWSVIDEYVYTSAWIDNL